MSTIKENNSYTRHTSEKQGGSFSKINIRLTLSNINDKVNVAEEPTRSTQTLVITNELMDIKNKHSICDNTNTIHSLIYRIIGSYLAYRHILLI
jgi:hypothetical protein